MVLKEIIRFILYIIHKRPYKQKVYGKCEIISIRSDSNKELFYGYYDKTPEKNGKVLFHEMNEDDVNIIVKDIQSKDGLIICKSKAYNWQLGTRAMWINDDIIVYNDYDGKNYVAQVYSLNNNEIILTLEKSIQDYSCEGFYLGVNYQRLCSYAKEYGYYCLPELTEKEFGDYEHDGIWQIDGKTGKAKIVLTIQQIMNCCKGEHFEEGKHFVNHIMIAPNGSSFIFIHRYYIGKERFDRLMYYDFKALTCLLSDRVQSHYCWLDSFHVFGYGSYQGMNGFHTINVTDGMVECCEELTRIHPKDGHPTVHGDWVVVDSYPNLSRMQELIAFNLKTKKHVKLLEVFHDLKHKGFDHPRFSEDGKRVYFDTIYTGKRQLCCIDVSSIINDENEN